MTNYQKSITVKQPAATVYNAITRHIADWWSDDLTGATALPGDQYTIAFGKTQKTFSITEATPNKRVVWQCDKAHIDMASLKNKEEWVGTKLIWALNTNGQSTTLDLLHEGLSQSFECYDVCEAGWDYFLGSLHAFLTTGTGTPYSKQQPVADKEDTKQAEAQ